MELAKVIGNMVATRKVENVEGVRFMVIQPINHKLEARGEPIIASDATQAGPGDIVYWVQGREAALALPQTFNPSDAAIVGIVDDVYVEETDRK